MELNNYDILKYLIECEKFNISDIKMKKLYDRGKKYMCADIILNLINCFEDSFFNNFSIINLIKTLI